jgi:hypothetical protein
MPGLIMRPLKGPESAGMGWRLVRLAAVAEEAKPSIAIWPNLCWNKALKRTTLP